MVRDEMLTAERVRQLLTYDPDARRFRWKFGRKGVHSGDLAGSLDARRSRMSISIDGWTHEMSRVAWLYFKGSPAKGQVHFLDGNSLNLDEANLAVSTRPVAAPAASEHPGVTYIASANKWQAQVNWRGKMYYLGRYLTPEEGSKVVEDFKATRSQEDRRRSST